MVRTQTVLIAVLLLAGLLVAGTSSAVALENELSEPNGDFSSAGQLAFGTHSGAIVASGGEDYYKVDLDQGQDLTVSMRFIHDSADLDLEVYGPSRNRMGSSASTSNSEQVSITAQQSGTHYIKIYSFGSGTAQYTLDVSPTGSGNMESEPNGDFSNADDVTAGSYIGAVRPDYDYFAVDLDQGDYLNTSLRFVHDVADLDLEVYSPNRNLIANSVSDTDDENVALTAQQSGTYYINISSSQGGAPYILDVSAPQGQGNDLDVRVTQIDSGSFPNIESFVSVTDSSGNPVSGLSRSNFDITEDGTSTSINTFERVSSSGGTDISAALVLDRSGSMKGFGSPTDEDRLVDAAKDFVGELRSGDEAEIINFGNLVRVEQRWTSDNAQLENAIEQSVSDDSSTQLYDAIAEGVEDANLRQGRSAVIAITDGANNAGNIRDHTEVIDIAQQNNVPIYTIGLGVSSTSLNSVNKTELKNRTRTEGAVVSPASRNELTEIATQTGGEYYETPDSSDLSSIYQDISQSISEEYRMTYSTPNAQEDGTTRQVQVEVQSSGDSGSGTGTYDAPASEPPEIPKQPIEQDIDVNGLTVTFNASTASDPDGTIQLYEWDFENDGQIDATGQIVSHTYSSAGDYDVKLILTDDSGAISQEIFDVSVGGGQLPITASATSVSPGGQATVDVTAENTGSITIQNIPTSWSVQGSQDDGAVVSPENNGDAISSQGTVTWAWPTDQSTVDVSVDLSVPSTASITDHTLSAEAENGAGEIGTDTTTVSVINCPFPSVIVCDYDRNGDGSIDTGELQDGINDFVSGNIDTGDLQDIIQAFINT